MIVSDFLRAILEAAPDLALAVAQGEQDPTNVSQAEGLRVLGQIKELQARGNTLLAETQAALDAHDEERARTLLLQHAQVLDELNVLQERVGRIAGGARRGGSA